MGEKIFGSGKKKELRFLKLLDQKILDVQIGNQKRAQTWPNNPINNSVTKHDVNTSETRIIIPEGLFGKMTC